MGFSLDEYIREKRKKGQAESSLSSSAGGSSAGSFSLDAYIREKNGIKREETAGTFPSGFGPIQVTPKKTLSDGWERDRTKQGTGVDAFRSYSVPKKVIPLIEKEKKRQKESARWASLDMEASQKELADLQEQMKKAQQERTAIISKGGGDKSASAYAAASGIKKEDHSAGNQIASSYAAAQQKVEVAKRPPVKTVSEPEPTVNPYAGKTAAELKAMGDQLAEEVAELDRQIRETGIRQEESAYTAGDEERLGYIQTLNRLGKERDKKNDEITGISGAYYVAENQENRARAAGDAEGQEKLYAVKTTREDLEKLGRVAAGFDGSEEGQRERAYLMEKYGLTERELEIQAPELIRQLQSQLETVKEEAKDAGYDYDRMREFDERLEKAETYPETQKRTAQYAKDHPYLASGASVLANFASGADYFGALLGNMGHNDPLRLDSYVPLDVYDMHATNFVRTVRGTVAQKLEENPAFQTEIGGQNVYSFLYQTGMSMGDFLFTALMTGNFASGVRSEGVKKAAENLSLAIMGSGAASNATVDAINRGLSNQQALTLGAIAGFAEVITEKVSLETLLDKTSMDRNALGYIVKNVLAEGSEEVASDFINLMADVLVSKDKSRWKQSIAEYEAQGYSPEEAFGLALKDQVISMGWSGLGGGLSGGLMSGGNVAINSYQNWTSTERKTFNNIIQEQGNAANTGIDRGRSETELNDDMRQVEWSASILGEDGAKALMAAYDRSTAALYSPEAVVDEFYKAYSIAYQEELENVGTKENAAQVEGDKMRHALKGIREDGIEVYESEAEILALPYKERMTRFQSIMEEEYAGRTARFTIGDEVLYAKFEGHDIQKNIYGDKKSDRAGWRAKINAGASGDIFDLVENAEYRGPGKEKGKITRAHKNVTGWEYFIKTVQIDGKVFDLLANVRKKAEGEYVYSIQLNENKKKAPAPLLTHAYGSDKGTGYAQNGVLTDASTHSISQPSPKSNSKLSQKESGVPEYIRLAAEDSGRRDAIRAKQAAYFGETAGLVRDSNFKKAHLSTRTARLLDALGKVLGVEIRFVEHVNGGRANGSYENGVITIALDATDPVGTVVSHEIVHRLRQTDPASYGKLVEFVKRHMSEAGLERELEARRRSYGDKGTSYLSEELVADAFGRIASMDALMEKLVLEDRTLGQKIMDFFTDILNAVKRALSGQNVKLTEEQRAAFQELKGHLEEAQAVFTNAVRAAEQQTTKLTEQSGAKETAATEGGEALRYLLKEAESRLLPYSAWRVETLDKVPGNVIVDTKEQLVELVNEAFENPQSKKSLHLGVIPESVIEKINQSAIGVPVELREQLFKENREYSLEIGQEDIRHLIDEKRGMTREDAVMYVQSLPIIVAEFDSAQFTYYQQGKNNLRALRFVKSLSDGTYIAVDVVSRKKNMLETHNIFMKSSDYIAKKKSANSMPVQDTAQGQTSETLDGYSSDTSISQSDEKSNRKLSLKDSEPTEDMAEFQKKNEQLKHRYCDELVAAHPEADPEAIENLVEAAWDMVTGEASIPEWMDGTIEKLMSQDKPTPSSLKGVDIPDVLWNLAREMAEEEERQTTTEELSLQKDRKDDKINFKRVASGTKGRKMKLRKLSKQEWRQIQSAQIQKYAGMDEDSIPETDYVFAHDKFYLLRNYCLGYFEVTKRLDPATDQERINIYMEEFENEND